MCDDELSDRHDTRCFLVEIAVALIYLGLMCSANSFGEAAEFFVDRPTIVAHIRLTLQVLYRAMGATELFHRIALCHH